MARVVKLQEDLNALLIQETKANSEKHLVLSMLCESYTTRLREIGYGYHTLIGFYQQAVEVINSHLKEHKLKNLLVDTQNNPTAQSLLQKARKDGSSFSQRWDYLDFEKAISSHLEAKYLQDKVDDTTLVGKSGHPLFTKPFFIALKNLQS